MYTFGKKNVRFKKIRGQAYTSATGKITNAKTFESIICNNFISDAKQKELNNKFYILGYYNLQTTFLFGLVTVNNKKRTYNGTIHSDKS